RGDGVLLRRPISVCEIGSDFLSIVFEIKGEGTRYLSGKKPGDTLDVLGPLGNSFSLEKGKKALIAGGGIGIFPLYELAKFYGADATVLLGFRNRSAAVMCAEFAVTGAKVLVATDDGSIGFHGNAVNCAEKKLDGKFDIAYACGPKPMLKAFAGYTKNLEIPCEISMEERMGCGIGACLVCACKTKKAGTESYSHVCSDGPVFNVAEVVFE
ncbi:MAG: dihydroorotate dehydrogenase electron transfer subunit, partial [Bacillota bacterium]|nr:dihydroorotate dehydrogenase electron transfer subunit [Bacillota bacterium]